MKNQNTNYKTLWGKDITEDNTEHNEAWHIHPEKEVIGSFPLAIDIEATSACNLRCPTCIQTITPSKKGFMNFDLYEKIIDEASEYGCAVKYHTIGRGEPLLHLNIVKMVQYAKKKGLYTCINTNGILLTDKVIWGLLDSGLDRISISIDYCNKQQYEEVRPGASFDQLESNIDYLKVNRDIRNYKTKIRIQSIDLPDFDEECYVHRFSDCCDEIGLISYKDMSSRGQFTSNWKCPQLWQRMSVLYDGEALPCNHDDRMFAVLGNAKTDSIGKIWRSSAMNYMRQLHSTGNAHLISACNGCFLRTAEANKGETK